MFAPTPLKQGREGKVYAYPHDDTKVIKVFRKNKNHDELIREFQLQRDAARCGLAPPVHSITRHRGRWGLVMDRMTCTLMDEMRRTNDLDEKWQRAMVRLLRGLDECGIFHGDVSPLNFMVDARGRLRVIDFGMSRRMDDAFRRRHGRAPNVRLGIAAFVLKLRELVPSFQPRYLLSKTEIPV